MWGQTLVCFDFFRCVELFELGEATKRKPFGTGNAMIGDVFHERLNPWFTFFTCAIVLQSGGSFRV